MTTISDRLLVLDVSLITNETIVHKYPIPPYASGNEASITQALDKVQEILAELKLLIEGEVRALKYPTVAYNPAHIVRVKIEAENAHEIQEVIADERRTLGFPT